ncbi:helix-turn-helix domain-containing protein [Catenovulum sediminis]|uniref:helix-turn-helix domain-containing protein n=1 Tax=Catenovulum sediminis TaxID=1740262 RepID=UPI001180F66F|nr:helix-turn-helix transcriptional regulator [Catenovulum sediminis]
MGSFLQSERKRLGLTASDVQQQIEVGRSTYTRWEAGQPIPSDKLNALASIGFDIGFVVTGHRSQVDESALADCIEILEDVIQETGKHYTATQKAKIIAVLYEEYTEDTESITAEKIQRHLRLVS